MKVVTSNGTVVFEIKKLMQLAQTIFYIYNKKANYSTNKADSKQFLKKLIYKCYQMLFFVV